MVRFEDFSWGAGVYLGAATCDERELACALGRLSLACALVRLSVAFAFPLGLKYTSVEITQPYVQQTASLILRLLNTSLLKPV